jgi:hypothetical protein
VTKFERWVMGWIYVGEALTVLLTLGYIFPKWSLTWCLHTCRRRWERQQKQEPQHADGQVPTPSEPSPAQDA